MNMNTFNELYQKYVELYGVYINNPYYRFTSDEDSITIIKLFFGKNSNSNEINENSSFYVYGTEFIKFNKFFPDQQIKIHDENIQEITFNVTKSLEVAYYSYINTIDNYTGLYKAWNEDGSLSEVGSYFDGKQSGTWVSYENDKKKLSVEYLDGYKIKSMYFNSNEELISTSNYGIINEKNVQHGQHSDYISLNQASSIMYKNGKIVDDDLFNRCFEKCSNFESENEIIDDSDKDIRYCYALIPSLNYNLITIFKTDVVNDMKIVCDDIYDEDFARYTTTTKIIPLLIFNKFNPDEEFTEIHDWRDYSKLICKIGEEMNINENFQISCYCELQPVFYNGLTNENFSGQILSFSDSGLPIQENDLDIDNLDIDNLDIDKTIDNFTKAFGLNIDPNISNLMTSVVKNVTHNIKNNVSSHDTNKMIDLLNSFGSKYNKKKH